MIDVGRVCVKTAGRDAGRKCVVVEIVDKQYVVIDVETRRRKCNITHLLPLKDTVNISESANHEEVEKLLNELGIDTLKTNPKKKTERPRSKRKTPEQLKEQKEEKKKLRGILKSKKEDKSPKTTIEDKAIAEIKETDKGKDVNEDKNTPQKEKKKPAKSKESSAKRKKKE